MITESNNMQYYLGLVQLLGRCAFYFFARSWWRKLIQLFIAVEHKYSYLSNYHVTSWLLNPKQTFLKCKYNNEMQETEEAFMSLKRNIII